uniref:SFRICE_013707 n=1 Tax=Spodoptera frugiperda TaxID=7108 RepID=A0A2H1W6I4_SPOFR
MESTRPPRILLPPAQIIRTMLHSSIYDTITMLLLAGWKTQHSSGAPSWSGTARSRLRADTSHRLRAPSSAHVTSNSLDADQSQPSYLEIDFLIMSA